jgi:hypothetical protein
MKRTFLKAAVSLVVAVLTTTTMSMASQLSVAQPPPDLSPNAMVVNSSVNNQLGTSIWTRIADITEGGRLDTDFNATWLAEWWYLNGKVKLLSMDGKRRDLGFFVVVGHQESAVLLDGASQLYHFYGLYFEDGTSPIFYYTDKFIPRIGIDNNYLGLRTPYVDFKYNFDNDKVRMYGSGVYGYWLNYFANDTGLSMNLFFSPKVIKTIDQADYPVPFNTYERANGSLYGSISLDGKKYWITSGEGYFDHMMPRGITGPWTWEFHGWNWFEVTTERYQAVFYGTRSLDGDDNPQNNVYSFKHLTMLDKRTGEVLAEYFGDEIDIVEENWEDYKLPYYKRPKLVTILTTDGTKLQVEAKIENVFDGSPAPSETPPYIGFVDFMSHQPDGATIQYKGNKESGNSFFEYLLTVPSGF